jgi:carboxypeptidase T
MIPRRLFTILGLFALVLNVLIADIKPLSGDRRLTVQDIPALLVVRIYYEDPKSLAELASRLEPWEVHADEGYIVVGVTPQEYQGLQKLGLRLEIDQARTAQVNRLRVISPTQVSGIPRYECYRTVEETYATAQALADARPDLASWVDIGDSWEKTQDSARGYDLNVLRLTNSAISVPKPKLFIMSSMHAREYAPAELNTRFAEYLLEQYNLDPDVTWLLDYQEIHLLLQANPDGRKHAEAGEYWRKNTNTNYCPPDPDYPLLSRYGVDLNRNYAFQWGVGPGSSSDPCDEVYRGPNAASEPETQAVQDYLLTQFPDQRADSLSASAPITATGVFIDLHSYSPLVLWPWGFTGQAAPNEVALQTLGRKLAYFNGYPPTQASNLYPTAGTTDDFAYGELGLASFTFEMGTDFFQDCSTFENTILPDNLSALLYAAKTARTPYQTPSGPDITQMNLDPLQVAAGEPLTLTAWVDDTRYNNVQGIEPTQIITAAEYYIDIPPWITSTLGISYTMDAVDDSFDAPQEQVYANLDTTALDEGRHILYIRGQDAAGNWGAFSALFLQILPQPPFKIFIPVIQKNG